MPRDQHYHQAANVVSNVLGADAANEREAYQQSIEQIAKLFELAETYQDFLAAAEASGTGGNPRPGKSKAA